MIDSHVATLKVIVLRNITSDSHGPILQVREFRTVDTKQKRSSKASTDLVTVDGGRNNLYIHHMYPFSAMY